MKKKKKKPTEPVPPRVTSYRADGDCLRFLWDFPMYGNAEYTEIVFIHMHETPNDKIPTLFGAN